MRCVCAILVNLPGLHRGTVYICTKMGIFSRNNIVFNVNSIIVFNYIQFNDEMHMCYLSEPTTRSTQRDSVHMHKNGYF